MKILVTGHDGNVGSVLAPMLAAAGHDVTGIDCYWFEPCRLYPAVRNFDARRLDIRRVQARDVAGFDAVVHLAALCNDPLGELNPSATDAINHAATARLAELAREAGVRRFIQASSCSLYGASDGSLIDETAAFNPVSAYGRSKAMAEAALSMLADDRFSPTFLRFATAYGVAPKFRADLVVNNLVGLAVITGEVLLKSSGEAWRPLIHVEDMARAILAACEAPRELIHNEAFNVGRTVENYRIVDVAGRVAARVPESRIEYADRDFRDPRNYRVNCDKIARHLPAFRPRWSLEAGIDELAGAYRRYAVDYARFAGPDFGRLQRLNALREARSLDDELYWQDELSLASNE